MGAKETNMGYSKAAKTSAFKSNIDPANDDTPPNEVFEPEKFMPGPPVDTTHTVDEITAHLEGVKSDLEAEIARVNAANDTSSNDPTATLSDFGYQFGKGYPAEGPGWQKQDKGDTYPKPR
jgi:hypothetical protein